MRIIKLGLISVVVFALLITAFSLFFPSHIRISKAIDINTSKDLVMMQVRDPANWQKWFPGSDSAEQIIEDQKKVVGIRSKNKQELIIEKITDSSVLATTKTPGIKNGESGWNLIPASIPNTITVQWYMDFHLRWYPWEKFSSLLLEKRYGPMLENGLENLKKLMEK